MWLGIVIVIVILIILSVLWEIFVDGPKRKAKEEKYEREEQAREREEELNVVLPSHESNTEHLEVRDSSVNQPSSNENNHVSADNQTEDTVLTQPELPTCPYANIDLNLWLEFNKLQGLVTYGYKTNDDKNLRKHHFVGDKAKILQEYKKLIDKYGFLQFYLLCKETEMAERNQWHKQWKEDCREPQTGCAKYYIVENNKYLLLCIELIIKYEDLQQEFLNYITGDSNKGMIYRTALRYFCVIISNNEVDIMPLPDELLKIATTLTNKYYAIKHSCFADETQECDKTYDELIEADCAKEKSMG